MVSLRALREVRRLASAALLPSPCCCRVPGCQAKEGGGALVSVEVAVYRPARRSQEQASRGGRIHS